MQEDDVIKQQEEKLSPIESFDPDSPFTGKLLLWQKNFGEIYELVLNGPDKKYYAYFKKPARQVIMAFYSTYSKDSMKANELLFQSCLLEADQEVLTNDVLYVSALLKVNSIVDFYSSVLKKNL